jgi:hypothetical protein
MLYQLSYASPTTHKTLPENSGNPRTHSRSAHNTAQLVRLAHTKRRSKPTHFHETALVFRPFPGPERAGEKRKVRLLLPAPIFTRIGAFQSPQNLRQDLPELQTNESETPRMKAKRQTA